MSKYYYDKYDVTTTTTYTVKWLNSPQTRVSSLYRTTGYTSYTLNPNGTFSVSGSYYSNSTAYNWYLYTLVNSTTVSYQYASSLSGSYYYQTGTITSIPKITSTRNNYINTLVSEEGIYPDNGLYTDGYWYVKKDKVISKYLIQQGSNIYNINPSNYTVTPTKISDLKVTDILTDLIIENNSVSDWSILLQFVNLFKGTKYKLLKFVK